MATKKKQAVTNRLASIGAALPDAKVTAAGVTVKKGPGGRPKKYAEGEKDRVTLVLSSEDRSMLERFSLWISARDGKRYSLAESLLLGLHESPVFVQYMKGR